MLLFLEVAANFSREYRSRTKAEQTILRHQVEHLRHTLQLDKRHPAIEEMISLFSDPLGTDVPRNSWSCDAEYGKVFPVARQKPVRRRLANKSLNKVGVDI